MSALRDALRDLPDAVFADLLESDEGYVLVVDLPGAAAETTEVLAEDGRIVIEGRREKAVPEGFRYVREDRPLFLDAELPLPGDADGGGADAEMDRGVLEVTIPKRTDGASRTIPVDEADGDVDDGSEAEANGGNDGTAAGDGEADA
ncbi:Hsp20/alpha crystallin family protein [Halorubrum amylolyticum]|uniref:Hsp20/alpha crystallin family protein n=1 Tax=Halorubrum amylolyticum TaxID=2508724 RepID=UPI0010090454|nr:Hsp20/alpha crystallin family protein [Halorubrum amylolyticum]